MTRPLRNQAAKRRRANHMSDNNETMELKDFNTLFTPAPVMDGKYTMRFAVNMDGIIVYTDARPNLFNRTMQRLLLGIVWGTNE